MNTQRQDWIIDHVGAKSWEQVEQEFRGQSLEQVKTTLDDMFPDDDNGRLAEAIVAELSK